MNPKLKNFLMIVIKNAVNAVLASGILKVLISGTFNMAGANDWWNLGKACASVIIAREIVVWGPILLNWTQTNADPSTLQLPAPEQTQQVKFKPPNP